MPTLTLETTQPESIPHTSATPALQFLKLYRDTVDSAGYKTGTGLAFYSRTMTYHNSNGAIYHGGEQMWRWMKELFGAFERLQHELTSWVETKQDDDVGSANVVFTAVRRIWVKGNDGPTPDVEVPMAWRCNIGPGDGPEAALGLQFRECWIYWDTAMLAPFMSKDAVVFRRVNPEEEEEEEDELKK